MTDAKELIEQLPAGKKQALAALCLAQFCTAKKIDRHVIAPLVEHLLSVLVRTDLPKWERETRRHELNTLRWEIIRPAFPSDVPEALFCELLNAVLQVGCLNMYSGPSKRPLKQLRIVFQILKDAGVAIPSFDESFYTQDNADPTHWSGWGKMLDAAAYEKVLNVYRRVAKIRSEMVELTLLTARARTAYSLACLENLAAKLNYTSPKYRELLAVLWSFTETKHYGEWNRNVTSYHWGDYYNYGMWLGTNHADGNLISKTDPFADAPEAVVGMMGLCALIGESHLYGAFQSDCSEAYLDKVLTIMDNHDVPLPAMGRFQKNSLEIAGKGKEMGFPAPRSFYIGDQAP